MDSMDTPEVKDMVQVVSRRLAKATSENLMELWEQLEDEEATPRELYITLCKIHDPICDICSKISFSAKIIQSTTGRNPLEGTKEEINEALNEQMQRITDDEG